GHRHASVALFIAEETSYVDVHLPAAGRIAFLHTEQIHVVHIVSHVLRVHHAARRKQHGGDILHALATLPQVPGVIVGQVLTGAFLGAEIIDPEAHREFENDDRIRPEAAQYG